MVVDSRERSQMSEAQLDSVNLFREVRTAMQKLQSLYLIYLRVANERDSGLETFGQLIPSREEVEKCFLVVQGSNKEPSKYRVAVPPQITSNGSIKRKGIAVGLPSYETAKESIFFELPPASKTKKSSTPDSELAQVADFPRGRYRRRTNLR